MDNSKIENISAEPKTDGFKFIFKQPARLTIFIVTLVLSLVCFICAGVFSYSLSNSYSSNSSHYTSGKVYANSSNAININGSYTYYEFTPSYSGYYSISTSTYQSSSYSYSYSSSSSYLNTAGVIYDKKWNILDSDINSGTSGSFLLYAYLNSGKTYYIGVKLNSSSYTSVSCYLKISY